jgi:hypothetical protein
MKDLKKLTAPLEVAHKCPLRRTLNRIFQLIGDFAVPDVRQWTAHHSGNAWSRGLTSELHRSGAMNWCQSERCDIDGL